MRKYISDYIKNIDSKSKYNREDLEELKQKIIFFEYERLIHLIVTFFFSLFAIIFMALGMISYIFLIIFAMLIIFVLFYIVHYFFLEISVQYLYKVYDRIKSQKELK